MSGGNNNELKCISALCINDSVYKSSLTGIKIGNIKILRELSAILNSSFFSYFNIETFSSTGIEREETHDEEKFNTPYSTIDNLEKLVLEIEKLFVQLYKVGDRKNSVNLFSELNFNVSIDQKLVEIDSAIQKAFSCNQQELDLMNYANDVIIPVIMKHEGYEKYLEPLPNKDHVFELYASLFLDRFKSRKEIATGKRFVVEIWYSSYIIGMLFRRIPEDEYISDIVWVDKQSDDVDILSFLIKISSEKITDRLFVQKDLRGFEKDYFYIFKPNEERLWHKAIGYLDVNEFADAILKEGRKKK